MVKIPPEFDQCSRPTAYHEEHEDHEGHEANTMFFALFEGFAIFANEPSADSLIHDHFGADVRRIN